MASLAVGREKTLGNPSVLTFAHRFAQIALLAYARLGQSGANKKGLHQSDVSLCFYWLPGTGSNCRPSD